MTNSTAKDKERKQDEQNDQLHGHLNERGELVQRDDQLNGDAKVSNGDENIVQAHIHFVDCLFECNFYV